LDSLENKSETLLSSVAYMNKSTLDNMACLESYSVIEPGLIQSELSKWSIKSQHTLQEIEEVKSTIHKEAFNDAWTNELQVYTSSTPRYSRNIHFYFILRKGSYKAFYWVDYVILTRQLDHQQQSLEHQNRTF
jgi:phage-related protein